MSHLIFNSPSRMAYPGGAGKYMSAGPYPYANPNAPLANNLNHNNTGN